MIWEIILEELKKELPEVEFNRYIKNIKFDEKNSKSDCKILIVENIFLKNWILRNYAEKIATLFRDKTDYLMSVLPKIEIKIKTQKDSKKPEYIQKIVQINQKNSILNSSFTFENFMVGNSNEFAYSMAQKVAKEQGTTYNPLFISGDTGLGKTHLLNAIGNANVNTKNVILTTSENFLNELRNHIMHKNTDIFRDKYRNCDYLLVDDIQFMAGKEMLQEEFFHTFNELKNNNKQIVLTSDRPLGEIGLEKRLKSRFINGILAEIYPPDLETKIAIIKKKCELDLIFLNNEIIHYIAVNVNENIREIEGILMNINARMYINGEITLDSIKSVIKDYKSKKTEEITLDDIISGVSRILNVKPSDIKNNKRTKDIQAAKKIVIFLARKLTTNSTGDLANFLGMKDHSSIVKATKKIESEIEQNDELKIKIEEIKNKIKDFKNN